MGSAAAMQALKMFSGGSGGGSQQQGGQQGGGGQNQFVGMAMAQASKLFDQQHAQGNVQSGNKNDAVSSAAQMALKMFMKSQGGGGGGGGMGGLMSMASKFM
ncbi:hypothetical protein LTR86_003874 [Recurvomyces mirabilis]|nr:hypothetical protein LTR86_003874 [Recurvomyces mirabilis]